MAQNKMFPLEVSNVKSYALVSSNNDEKIWHLRYGHFHVKGLKLLAQKNMVVGLLKIDDLDFCEGCVYRKQNKNLFPVNKSLKAFACIEIVHTDVCDPMSVESFCEAPISGGPIDHRQPTENLCVSYHETHT